MQGKILLPSLNRPHLLKRFFDAYRETEATAPGMVLIDELDYSANKGKYDLLELPPDWCLRITKAVTMGDKVREVWEEIVNLDYVSILNDDHIPRTKNWDQLVLKQINGHNVVFTNDGPTPDKPWNAPGRISGMICFSGPILKALGWMFPKDLHHLYSDEVWGFLFSQAKCCQAIMDVCVEHDHAYKDEAQRDDTYYKINGKSDFASPEPKGGLWESDRAAFQRWFQEDAQKDLAKLMAIMPKEGFMVATPTHNGDCAFAYALGLGDMGIHFSQSGWHFEVAMVEGSSLIPHARNSLVDMFLKSKCQKLLFIDSDQGFNRDAVIRLLSSNKRIIAGITPHKRFPINLNFEPLPEDHKHFQSLTNKGEQEFFKFAKEKADPTGEIEVDRVGTGFLMIDRSVFEIMKDHVPKYLAFDNDPSQVHYEFFKMGSDGEMGKYRGEDWHFCELAKKLKIPIFINSNVFLSHKGNFTFAANEALRNAQ